MARTTQCHYGTQLRRRASACESAGISFAEKSDSFDSRNLGLSFQLRWDLVGNKGRLHSYHHLDLVFDFGHSSCRSYTPFHCKARHVAPSITRLVIHTMRRPGASDPSLEIRLGGPSDYKTTSQ